MPALAREKFSGSVPLVPKSVLPNLPDVKSFSLQFHNFLLSSFFPFPISAKLQLLSFIPIPTLRHLLSVTLFLHPSLPLSCLYL